MTPQPNEPRSAANIYLLLLLVIVVSGCQSGSTRVDGTTDPASLSNTLEPEETLWSSTLHWGEARFRFELETGGKNTTPQIERNGQRDILRVGDLQVELIRTRFRIAGVHYRWQPDSIIWIHRPPHRDRPFFRQQGTLQLTWVGNGETPVVEEQLSDGSFIWTMGPARVIRDHDGTVHYQGRSSDRSQSGPWKIYIDEGGRLIGALQ